MVKDSDRIEELQTRINSLKGEINSLKRELDSLLEISNLLAVTEDPQPVFDQVLERAMSLSGAESGSLMLVDDQTLKIVACKGLDPKIVRQTRPHIGEGIAGWVVQHGRPLLLVGGVKLESFAVNRPLKDALSVPLRTDNRTLGVLNVNNSPKGRTFSQSDLNLLYAFASQAALAVKMLQAREIMEAAYLSVIEALAEAIDAKDPYTAGHSRRVSDYATTLARLMGVPNEETKKIGLAALLHDIGKIGISEDILRKPATLDINEEGLIKAHPVISAKILEPVSTLRDILPIIRHHHEHYDGSGYPAGLRGDEIPAGSRLLAIVDAFDAMASGRAYRRVMSLDEIITELHYHQSSQFDPHILNVFVEAIKSGEISLAKAIIVGQEVAPTPMTFDELKFYIRVHPRDAFRIVRQVTDYVLDEVEHLGGGQLKMKLNDSLVLAAADNNLQVIFEREEEFLPMPPEQTFEKFCRYFGQVRAQLIEVVGPRLTERLLIESADILNKIESRVYLMILKQLGIEKPIL